MRLQPLRESFAGPNDLFRSLFSRAVKCLKTCLRLRVAVCMFGASFCYLFGRASFRVGKLSLAAARVPDGTGRLVVAAFAPDDMSHTIAVNCDAEIISERKAKAARQNVVVACDRPGEPHFSIPGGAAIGRDRKST